MILETVPIPFDPATESEEIQEIFANDIARTLWLGIRQSHSVSQHFNASCLRFAKEIEKMKRKRPLTTRELFHIISARGFGDGFQIIGPMEQDFAAELLPFVNDERTIGFEIKQ